MHELRITRMPESFPSSFEIWQYSHLGKVLFYAEFVVGCGLPLLIRRLRAQTRVLDWFAIGLVFTAVMEHLVAFWALLVDPGRGSGTLPLPQPFQALGYLSMLVFDFVGPLVAGILVGRSLVLNRLSLVPRALAYVAIAAYALYISPWAGVIIAD